MRAASLLPWWLRLCDHRPPEEIADDIRAELEFHLAELARELERQGLALDEAQRVAAQRFGDLDSYVTQCQRIKTGERIVLQRILLVVSVTLVVLVLLLAWQLLAVRSQQAEMVANLAQTQEKLAQLEALQWATPDAAPPVPERLSPITGTVRDNESRPLAGVDVLAIYKTWPGGRYQQHALTTTTSDDGTYALPEPLDIGGKHALQIAFAANGYCLASRYLRSPGEGRQQVAPQDETLVPADPLEIQLVDQDGKPATGATIVLTDRRAADGMESFVYHQAAGPLYQEADGNGRVTLRYFAAGDTVSGTMRLKGGEWRPIEFQLSAADQPLVVTVPEPLDYVNPIEF